MNNLEDNDTLTQRIIGCAIEVHRTLGPGSDFASSLPRGHPRHRLLSPFVLSTPSEAHPTKPGLVPAPRRGAARHEEREPWPAPARPCVHLNTPRCEIPRSRAPGFAGVAGAEGA